MEFGAAMWSFKVHTLAVECNDSTDKVKVFPNVICWWWCCCCFLKQQCNSSIAVHNALKNCFEKKKKDLGIFLESVGSEPTDLQIWPKALKYFEFIL